MELIKNILKDSTCASDNVETAIALFEKKLEANCTEAEASIIKYGLEIVEHIEDKDFGNAFYYFNKMNEKREELLKLAAFKTYLNTVEAA